MHGIDADASWAFAKVRSAAKSISFANEAVRNTMRGTMGGMTGGRGTMRGTMRSSRRSSMRNAGEPAVMEPCTWADVKVRLRVGAARFVGTGVGKLAVLRMQLGLEDHMID